jgi:hypothetical protein
MMPADLQVRCVGCGETHSAALIRCQRCRTLTRRSLREQPAPWPDDEPRRFTKGVLWAGVVSVPFWIVVLVAMAFWFG